MYRADGMPIVVTVQEKTETGYVMDCNHPLAGKDLVLKSPSMRSCRNRRKDVLDSLSAVIKMYHDEISGSSCRGFEGHSADVPEQADPGAVRRGDCRQRNGAIKAFSVSKPDIILLDLMMPIMDGYRSSR